jgi:hypothetical protein
MACPRVDPQRFGRYSTRCIGAVQHATGAQAMLTKGRGRPGIGILKCPGLGTKVLSYFVAALLLVQASPSNAGEPSTFIKPGQLQCVALVRNSLEQVLDAPSLVESARLTHNVVMRGHCLVGSGAQVVGDLEEFLTPANRPYICFHLYFSNDGLAKSQRMCSPSGAITTVANARAKRTGDFKVLVTRPGLTVAECAEGGVVSIEKTSSGWMRSSTLVFPQTAEPVRLIPPINRTQSLRQGCRGNDYRH